MSTEDLTPEQRKAHRRILLCFALATLSGVSWIFWYTWNDSIAAEGTSLGMAFVFLATGLVIWSHHLMDDGPFEEDFPELRSPAKQEAEVAARLDRGQVGRRRLLIGSAGAVGASVAGGALVNLRSFGPDPRSIEGTGWNIGRRAVTVDGSPVLDKGLPVGSLITVMPEGFLNSPQAVAVIIHLPPGANRALPGRGAWAPDGGQYVCYSKVCTHAGCPVDLYDHAAMELQCPCHQSTFAATHGAIPVFGPAGRALPQLPIAIDAHGQFYSTGPFSSPPGPAVWFHGEP